MLVAPLPWASWALHAVRVMDGRAQSLRGLVAVETQARACGRLLQGCIDDDDTDDADTAAGLDVRQVGPTLLR